MVSIFFRSLDERKPLSVEDADPYALFALAPVPVLVETVLEVRVLRILLDLLTTDGSIGTGRAERADTLEAA